jgi:hypothetical protein
MFNLVITVLNLLLINQIPTLNQLTIGPIIPNNPGLFTTTSPSILTRRPRTTTTPITTTTTPIISSTTPIISSTEPSEEDNTVLYIVVAVVFGLFGVFEMWYFICRRKKRDEVVPENVDRLYASIDYSGVYELPIPEEYTNENPPTVPEKPKYGVRVNTII